VGFPINFRKLYDDLKVFVPCALGIRPACGEAIQKRMDQKQVMEARNDVPATQQTQQGAGMCLASHELQKIISG